MQFHFCIACYIYYDNVKPETRHIPAVGRSLRGKVPKVLDCDLVASEFELQSCYHVHIRTNNLGKGMNHLISSPAIG